MNTSLSELLGQIRIGAKQAYGNMLLFCLLAEKEATEEFITLDHALENKYLVISEVSKSGTVPSLKVRNSSKYKVLLMDGEELVGAKQNRVLNTTILVGPYSNAVIPVSCVEQGRWSYNTENFQSRSRSMSAELRRNKTRSVTRNLRSGSSFYANQGAVWEDIDRKYDRLGVNRSSTMAMSDLYESLSVSAGDYIKNFKHVCGQIGILVCIDSEIAGLEILNRFEQFRQNHRKIVNSYILDALETAHLDVMANAASMRAKSKKFIEGILGATIETRSSVSLGNDIRLDSEHFHGAGLESENRILQLSVFPNIEENHCISQAPLRRASVRRRSR
ncbi:MAG: DUF6569 family protein, partial [Desulfomonilaceae bacterium]